MSRRLRWRRASAAWSSTAKRTSSSGSISFGAITPIPVGRGPSAIAVGKRAVWVSANALASGTVSSSTRPPISSTLTGSGIVTIPSNDALRLPGRRRSIWVANSGDGTVTRIDERTNLPSAPVTVGGNRGARRGGGQGVGERPAAEPTGGTLVVSVPRDITQFDPAVKLSTIDGGPIVLRFCSTLLRYPDEPLAGPAARAGCCARRAHRERRRPLVTLPAGASRRRRTSSSRRRPSSTRSSASCPAPRKMALPARGRRRGLHRRQGAAHRRDQRPRRDRPPSG